MPTFKAWGVRYHVDDEDKLQSVHIEHDEATRAMKEAMVETCRGFMEDEKDIPTSLISLRKHLADGYEVYYSIIPLTAEAS